MRKIFLLLLLFQSCITASAQIEIKKFIINNPVLPEVAFWKTGDVSLKAVSNKTSIPAAYLVVQIRKGNTVVYGNDAKTAMKLNGFEDKEFNAAELSVPLGTCKLEPGSYQLCVQFFNETAKPLSSQECAEFDVRTPDDPKEFYKPELQTPVDKQVIDESNTSSPIQFSWRGITPPPPLNNVKYILKIHEVRPGQSGDNALSSAPLLETEVYSTNYRWTIPKDLASHGKHFIWKVQGTDMAGKPYGKDLGISMPFYFSINAGCSSTFKLDSIRCLETSGEKSTFKICATYTAVAGNSYSILFNDPQNSTYNLPIPGHSLNNIIYSYTPGISLSNFTPALNTLPASITPGTSVSTCFIASGNPTAAYIKVRAFGLCNDNNQTQAPNAANAVDSIAVPRCICDPCEDMKIKVEESAIQLPKNGDASSMNIRGVFSNFDPSVIKKVTVEIIHFDIQQTGDKDCGECTENKQWGNFIPGGSKLEEFGEPTLNKTDYSHLATWTNQQERICGDTSVATGNDPRPVKFSLPVAVPSSSTLKCCKDLTKICVRFTFYDFCCRICEVIKCYEIRREIR